MSGSSTSPMSNSSSKSSSSPTPLWVKGKKGSAWEGWNEAKLATASSRNHLPAVNAEPLLKAVAAGLPDGTSMTPEFSEKIEEALAVVVATLEVFGQTGVSVSFNGGKDSIALVHLLHHVVTGQTEPPSSSGTSLKGFPSWHFQRKPISKDEEEFPEMLEYIKATDRAYGLETTVFVGKMEKALADALDAHPDPSGGSRVKAVLMGVRSTDPTGKWVSLFSPTTEGWPPMLRVNPIFNWSYSQVWLFLRALKIPYCSLYDRGFTSLGLVGDTTPNPALRSKDGTYSPAHTLEDNSLERAGRTPSQSSSTRRKSSSSASKSGASSPPPLPGPPSK